MEKLKYQKKINIKHSRRFFLKKIFTFFIFFNFFNFDTFKKVNHSKKLWILDKKD